MSITHELNSSGQHLVINVHGRFDYRCHSDFRESYRQLTHKPELCVVDLQDTTYLDSSALGILLLLKDQLGEQTHIKITNSSKEVKKILKIANFDRLFEIV